MFADDAGPTTEVMQLANGLGRGMGVERTLRLESRSEATMEPQRFDCGGIGDGRSLESSDEMTVRPPS